MSAAASAYGTIIWGINEPKTGRTKRPGKRTSERGHVDREAVERDTQPSEPERRLIDHRSRAQQAPIKARALEALEVVAMRPVGRSHLRQLDAAATRSIDVEQCRPCHEPADGPIGRRQGFDARDDAVDEIDETLAVGDIPGTIDEPVMSGDQAGELRRFH